MTSRHICNAGLVGTAALALCAILADVLPIAAMECVCFAGLLYLRSRL